MKKVPQESAGESDTGSSLCRACKRPIHPGASKCPECDSFQGWHRFVSFSATTLSLLVALISVSAYAVPRIASAFHTPKSDLRISVLSCSDRDGVIRILASNLGDRAVSVSSAAIRRRGDSSDHSSWRVYQYPQEAMTSPISLIKQEEQHEFVFGSERRLPQLTNTEAGEEWVLELNLVEAGQQRAVPTSVVFRALSSKSTGDVDSTYSAALVGIYPFDESREFKPLRSPPDESEPVYMYFRINSKLPHGPYPAFLDRIVLRRSETTHTFDDPIDERTGEWRSSIRIPTSHDGKLVGILVRPEVRKKFGGFFDTPPLVSFQDPIGQPLCELRMKRVSFTGK